jgi:hypothetical protein
MYYDTHTFDTKVTDSSEMVEVLRIMAPKWHAMIASISGSVIHLRCKDDKVYDQWVRAWREVSYPN